MPLCALQMLLRRGIYVKQKNPTRRFNAFLSACRDRSSALRGLPSRDPGKSGKLGKVSHNLSGFSSTLATHFQHWPARTCFESFNLHEPVSTKLDAEILGNASHPEADSVHGKRHHVLAV